MKTFLIAQDLKVENVAGGHGLMAWDGLWNVVWREVDTDGGIGSGTLYVRKPTMKNFVGHNGFNKN